jgi:hypothetical protein
MGLSTFQARREPDPSLSPFRLRSQHPLGSFLPCILPFPRIPTLPLRAPSPLSHFSSYTTSLPNPCPACRLRKPTKRLKTPRRLPSFARIDLRSLAQRLRHHLILSFSAAASKRASVVAQRSSASQQVRSSRLPRLSSFLSLSLTLFSPYVYLSVS